MLDESAGAVPWALQLEEDCEFFKILPNAGGLMDQDLQLLKVIKQVKTVKILIKTDAAKLFKLPAEIKQYRSMLTSLVYNEDI